MRQELDIAKSGEYHLRVPKVPKQFIDIFSRNIGKGDYGLSAEKVETFFDYARLQRTLSHFRDLTFPPEFLQKLPEDLRQKLSQNLYPEVSLFELEIPTSDKLLLVELLIAENLTPLLARSPVEFWVTEDLQKMLKVSGCDLLLGLQRVDYAGLSMGAKRLLLRAMEIQEMQVHTILLARQRFPKGVSIVGFLTKKNTRMTFNRLTDLEVQYNTAREALDNPLAVLLGEFMDEAKSSTRKSEEEKDTDSKLFDPDKPLPIDVKKEAQGKWWEANTLDLLGGKDYYEIGKAVADYLRPLYQGKTIYEILGAETAEEKQEVLAAFWRREGDRRIDFGQEAWVNYELYLNPNGRLELHENDEEFKRRPLSKLTEDTDVACFDQTVKWIKEEMERMKRMKTQWKEEGLEVTQLVECTLVSVLNQPIDPKVRKGIEGLPPWLLSELSQEVAFYRQLPVSFTPQTELDIDNLIMSSLRRDETEPRNMLRGYFLSTRQRLVRFQNLIATPEELFRDLDLDPSATQNQVKQAYRKIAKETGAIHVRSAEEFDPKEWQSMNDRFIKAARAYKVLTNRQLGDIGDIRLTSLGNLSSCFE